jgi:molybdopterin converting factor small subunit
MKIELKCFSTLVNPKACDFKDSTIYDLEDGQTVKNMAQRAGIDRENIKVAFVNNRIVDSDTVLSSGDRVGLAPATGGM